jgi:hypothetical protein
MSKIKHICRNCTFMRRSAKPKTIYKCRIKIMHGILPSVVKPSNECDVENGFQPLRILNKDE